MVIFDLRRRRCLRGPPQSFFKFKLFTLCLPLFCLLSWASSTATPPPPSSALAASQVLKTRGYFLFGTLIAVAAGTDSWNGTGTIFVPPDFAFSSTAAKFNNYGRSPPPRPSASLLLYHTLKQPLTWYNLTAFANGNELRTWQTNSCVFVSKVSNGDLAIAGTKKTIAAVQIRQPDLYVSDHLAIHGVDGVLDPNSMSKCTFPDQTVQIKSEVDQSFLDHAVRALSKRGYSVVATAMAINRSDLINLPAITVFAPSDASLFSDSNGFRYDFLHHVLPGRFRFDDIARLSTGRTIETLSPNKTVVFRSENGDVTVNGVAIDSSEVYANRWIVVLSVSQTIDDVGDSAAKALISNGLSDSGLAGDLAFSPSHSRDSVVASPFSGQLSDSASMVPSYSTDSEVNSQFPGEYSRSHHGRVPSPAPSYSYEVTSNGEIQAPARTREYGQDVAAENLRSSPSPATVGQALSDRRFSPGSSLAMTDGVMSTISHRVEGEDHFRPVSVRRMPLTSAYVDESLLSTPYGQLSEKLVQSGPSHQFNKLSKKVVESDENETGQLSEVSPSAEVGRRQLSSNHSSSSSEAKSGPSETAHVSVADDLFYYI